MPSARVTQLLERARQGDQRVADELMPLIYGELRSLAQHYMASERSDHTLQATALVNEAYLQLVGPEVGPWQDRAHFFAVAATTIRRILVQHARRKGCLKRGGDRHRADLDPALIAAPGGGRGGPGGAEGDHIVAVDEALQRLEQVDPGKARIVELRFFAGLTTEEIAEVLNVSPRTIARDWQIARAWLSRELCDDA